MSKPMNKKPVEMEPAARPSRIRREPLPADNAVTRKLDRIDFGSREWEVRFAIAGIVFFAVAIVALVFDIGHLLSY
ncbi:MAG TPA: hypothetical protein VIZ66_06515 [Sphingomicrobium sp.]